MDDAVVAVSIDSDEALAADLEELLPADKEMFDDGGTTGQVAAELEHALGRLGPDADHTVRHVRRTLTSVNPRSQ